LGLYLYTTNLSAVIVGSIAAGTNPGTNATHDLTGLGYFDIFFDPYFLMTDMTSGSVTFSNNSVNMGGTGFSSIFAQNLPFGLSATNPINWSFSSGTGSCTGSTGALLCLYSGTGELSWTTVPEPGILTLIGLGLLGAGLASRRRS